ncbi:MAG TPA: CBS domain-containing protein, partial [Solirubrobacteraceae bacterium]|nr:CBS domain-containing protein [Solirubrobacteraceae bacterium]
GNGPGIITERDVLVSVGRGQNPEQESVNEHLTRDVVFAAPDWSLEEAAAAMVRGSFRHLIVLEDGETVGILSVRDVVRCWTEDGAICPVPSRVAVG